MPVPEGGASIRGSRARFLLESVATGYFLTDAAANTSAKCLDGTPSLYYHRPGFDSGAQKWFVFMQGGGWCNTASASGEFSGKGYDNCEQRSSELSPAPSARCTTRHHLKLPPASSDLHPKYSKASSPPAESAEVAASGCGVQGGRWAQRALTAR
jgi:hypothetical protein